MTVFAAKQLLYRSFFEGKKKSAGTNPADFSSTLIINLKP